MHLKDAVLKNNLLKKFSRICCLLFNYQGSLLFVLESARLLYHAEFCLSRTFFYFFHSFECFVLFQQLVYSITSSLACQELFHFLFSSFIPMLLSLANQLINNIIFIFNCQHFSTSFSTFLFQHYSSRNPIHMIYSFEKRRRRDSNPRAAINDLLPFQGSPFGQLGYFSKMSVI